MERTGSATQMIGMIFSRLLDNTDIVYSLLDQIHRN